MLFLHMLIICEQLVKCFLSYSVEKTYFYENSIYQNGEFKTSLLSNCFANANTFIHAFIYSVIHLITCLLITF